MFSNNITIFFTQTFFINLGSVIRCMRRLEETLRQMVQAAKTIGNTELENKFSEGKLLSEKTLRRKFNFGHYLLKY